MVDFKQKIEEELGEEFFQDQVQKPKKRRLGLKIGGFLLVFVLLFIFTALISGDSYYSWMEKVPVLGKLVGLVESSDRDLKGEKEDRINILLLGMGGKKHEGGYLTDTIMLVSIQPSSKKVALMSIPRDLVIMVDGLGWQKVNAINALAERKKKDSGSEAVSQALSNVLDIPIHYYFRVDFEGFVNIIDKLGGLDVYVENTLSDYSYPISGQEDNPNYYARFEHLYIEKGWQKMDGTLALKFARSRHGQGVEGSDFARSKRQQKIIQAVKDKLLKSENLLKPAMMASIISELNEHVSYNVKTWEALKFWSKFKDVSSDNISNYGLDDGPKGLLYSDRSSAGAYILRPRSGDFSEIRYLVKNFFPETKEEYQREKEKEKVVELGENTQEAVVEVKNGTWITGLASKTAIDLEKNKFTVSKIGNSSKRDFKKTAIYDLSYGKKDEALKFLKDFLAADVFFEIPSWLANDIKKETGDTAGIVPDFIIILGETASNLSI